MLWLFFYIYKTGKKISWKFKSMQFFSFLFLQINPADYFCNPIDSELLWDFSCIATVYNKINCHNLVTSVSELWSTNRNSTFSKSLKYVKKSLCQMNVRCQFSGFLLKLLHWASCTYSLLSAGKYKTLQNYPTVCSQWSKHSHLECNSSAFRWGRLKLL